MIWAKDSEGNNVARVEYNDNLSKFNEVVHDFPDYDDNRSLGITKLKSGSYVLIHGTRDYNEDIDDELEVIYAVVVSDRTALNAIVGTGNDYMLDEPRYARLNALIIDSEDDGTEVNDVFTTETLVKRQGNSLVLIMTEELRQMGLDVGDAVGVTVYKKIIEGEQRND